MFRRLAIPFVMIVMAVVTTWPLATRLDRSIPQGAETSPTVPVFNLWTVGWNLDRVRSGWRDFWDAPHFAPTEKTLALSEPLIASQALAGCAWVPPPVAYNLFLLSAIALNAGVTWLALRHRRVPWPVALLVSLAMARLPFVHWQLGLLQCVLVAGLIGVIHFGEEAFATGRLSRLWLAAGCFDLTFLACGYYGVFLVLLLPFVVVMWSAIKVQSLAGSVVGWVKSSRPTSITGNHESRSSASDGGSRASTHPTNQLIVAVVGVLLILAMIAPVVLLQSRVLSDPHYARTREVIQELSARPTDYLATPFPEWLQFVGHARWHEATRWKLSPGLLKVALALFGLVVGVRSRSRRGWTLTWLAISVGGFVGSLGLNFQIAGWSPYGTLLDWFPTLARLRTPARMSVLVQIGVVFLAAEALLWGYRRVRIVVARSPFGLLKFLCRVGQARFERRPTKFLSSIVWWAGAAKRRWSHPTSQQTAKSGHGRPDMGVRTTLFAFGLFWLIGIAACCEVPLRRLSFVDVPPVETQKGWIDWLKNNTSQEAVIAHVPFPKGPLPRDYESESWAMYWGLFHHRRMVNGFSGFFPASYLELKSQMQSFPDEASFEALRARGVSHCVVKESFLDVHPLPKLLESAAPWERVFQDRDAGVVLFRLRR